MQFKNSLLLLTALTAGSAMARVHGHERRHQHPARAVGDMVTAVIDGQTVSWVNTYAGPTAAPAAPAAPAAADNVAAAQDDVAPSSSTAVPTTTTAATSPTSTGFGGITSPKGSGATYCGNVGNPYGSNMIRISKDDLNNYNYTITLDGSSLTQDHKVVFWNKCAADGTLTGFFATTFPLSFTVPAGSTEYVAVDTDSQGGFTSFPATESVPRNSYGSILGFWGEFDFADSANNGWSGFDVSAIQAQNAGKTDFPGLKLEANNVVSAITSNLASVVNAYTSSLAAAGGIGANIPPGPLHITATLGYSG